VSTVGRVFNIRGHGGSIFIDLVDEGFKLQVYLQRNVLGKAFEDFKMYLGRGDFLLVEGGLFFTRTGELTLRALKFSMISKALRGPHVKVNELGGMHGGLKDVEERYGKRYLDLLVDPEPRGLTASMVFSASHRMGSGSTGLEWASARTPSWRL